MSAKLHLLICKFFLREAQAVLQSGQFDDVTVEAYPDICVQPRASRIATMKAMFEKKEHEEQTTILVGACYLLQKGTGNLKEDRFHKVHREELCFYMLVNKTIVDNCLKAGSHLVTGGWLEHWQQHIDDWQFDQQTARMFFSEGARRLLLLDTGVDSEAQKHLREFGEFLALPVEVMPVGLEHFRLVFTHIIQAWRTAEAQLRVAEALSETRRKLADYMMSMDVIGKLTRLMDEEESIRTIVDLFTMLFGAAQVAYVSMSDDGPRTIYNNLPVTDYDTWIQTWINQLKPEDAYALTGTGFCVRVTYQNQTLGLIIADSIPFQQHEKDYLNLALGTVNLCGLAINNARLVSERQQAEQELRHKTEELARSNADLDQFAHVASHDLQSPLRRIISFSDLVLAKYSTTMNPNERDYIERIRASAHRMSRLTEGLLSYAKVKASGKEFTVVPLSVPLHQALEDLALRIEESKAVIEVTELPSIMGDEVQLYQLFQNLISNAIKFMPKERIPHIRISSSIRDLHNVEIRVQDNGIGIDAEHIEKIFQPFHRLHSQEQYPGSGIGLAVCEKIVRRHGGSITARSIPGEGTTFVICLPEYSASEASS